MRHIHRSRLWGVGRSRLPELSSRRPRDLCPCIYAPSLPWRWDNHVNLDTIGSRECPIQEGARLLSEYTFTYSLGPYV